MASEAARLSASAQRVSDAARQLGLDVEVRDFPEGTRTAEDAARAIGVAVGQIVKSLVFLADAAPIVCLVSGSNRVDTNAWLWRSAPITSPVHRRRLSARRLGTPSVACPRSDTRLRSRSTAIVTCWRSTLSGRQLARR